MFPRGHRERTHTGRSLHAGVWCEVRQILSLAVVAVLIAGGLLVKVKAAAGDLDTTFSIDGKQTTNFLASSIDHAYAVAIQADGKIVAAGFVNKSTMDFDIAVARYNTDGTLDTTFSGDGRQTTDFGGMSEAAYGVAIQSDGKIVVAGYTQNSMTGSDFMVARYNSDGTLDTAFSGDGKQTTDFGGNDVVTAMAIQGNGKIVLAGYTTGNSTSYDFAVARYNTNGALDTTFSTDGKQTTDFGNTSDHATAAAIQSNGRIVVVGYTFSTLPHYDFALARYTSTGTLDTSFSGDGKQITDFGNTPDIANAVAIQSNGRIVVAGSLITSSNSNFALARYNGNGSLDDGSVNDSTPNDSFGTAGHVTTDFFGSHDIANDVAIQADGRIVAAGYAAHANDTNHDFALARYNVDGFLDNTFSGDGKQNTSLFTGGFDEGHALAIQNDDKIVVAGVVRSTRFRSSYDFGLMRFLGD